MKIAIGNDHAGPDYKFAIVKLLESKRNNRRKPWHRYV